MGIKCPKCQFDNSEDFKFCKQHGTKIVPSEETPVTKNFITPSKGLDKGSTIMGKYRIIEKLGEGQMGVVYKAEDQRLRRTVGLKFLPSEFTRDREAKQRKYHSIYYKNMFSLQNTARRFL